MKGYFVDGGYMGYVDGSYIWYRSYITYSVKYTKNFKKVLNTFFFRQNTNLLYAIIGVNIFCEGELDMLELRNISKSYKMGKEKFKVLKDISLKFYENEFTSILGPSGSGKTTLLNIIGALDKYDEGDLLINGVSTKNYTDKDNDS